jgi:hypothetical protein
VDERRATVGNRIESQIEHGIGEQARAGKIGIGGGRLASISIQQLVAINRCNPMPIYDLHSA